MGQGLRAGQVDGRWDGGLLRAEQSALVASWLRSPKLLADFSWALADTKVLRVQGPDGQFVTVPAMLPQDFGESGWYAIFNITVTCAEVICQPL